MVQWLRLQASTAGARARVPIRELKIPYATQRSPNKQQQQQQPQTLNIYILGLLGGWDKFIYSKHAECTC